MARGAQGNRGRCPEGGVRLPRPGPGFRSFGPGSAPPQRSDGLGWSPAQFLEALSCFAPLWKRAEQAEAEIAAAKRGWPGHRKQYQMIEMLALDYALHACGSARAVIRELADPVTWGRLRRAAEAAWPDHPRWCPRLPPGRTGPCPAAAAQDLHPLQPGCPSDALSPDALSKESQSE